MTTRIRIQHLDSNWETEVVEMSKTTDGDVMAQKIPLPGKGDETEVYLHQGAYLMVREIPFVGMPKV